MHFGINVPRLVALSVLHSHSFAIAHCYRAEREPIAPKTTFWRFNIRRRRI